MVIGFMLLGSIIGTFAGLLGWAFGGMGLLAALGLYLGLSIGGAVLGAAISLVRGIALPALRPVRTPVSA